MKLLKYLISVFIFLFSGFGCQKIIHVHLNNAATQIVITGAVTDQPGPDTVTISTTVNYTAENVFPPVTDAFVTISTNGLTDTLSEIIPGKYITRSITGVPGNSYDLYVSTGGQVYTSTSIMPQPVPLDSVGYVSDRHGKRYNAVVYFQDPPGIANYYEFIEYNDGIEFKNDRGVFVFDDRLSDGKYISRTLYDDSTDLTKGDTVTIQLNCVDQNVYNYLDQLNLITRGTIFQSPTPDNPTSNITNKALGYFSAYTVEKESVFVP